MYLAETWKHGWELHLAVTVECTVPRGIEHSGYPHAAS